ncbi:MAG: hypothetical protein MHM6MM_004233 [Cercozoa sp. M6MM]
MVSVVRGKRSRDKMAKKLKQRLESAEQAQEEQEQAQQEKLTMFAESDEDEEADELHAFEKAAEEEDALAEEEARQFQEEEEEEAERASEELTHALRESKILPSPRERAAELLAPPDLTNLSTRIENILHVLDSLRARAEPGVSRSDYLEQLTLDLASYHGYNPELVEMFLGIFSPRECVAWIESNEQQRPVVLRVNTLRSRPRDVLKALRARGVQLEMLGDWSKVGIKVTASQVPIGATPEYLGGHYMLQSPSSFMPCMALDPQQGDKVVDVAAAPGGKTTYLAQLMQNTGVLIANDVSRERLRALKANCARLGVENVVVANYDGRTLSQHVQHVDRILLDAPCTGLGVISRDQSIKLSKSKADVIRMADLQKQLLIRAIDMLKEGGTVVYSTCSIMPQENEDVVNYALKKRYVKIVDTGLPFGVPGFVRWQERRFHPSVRETRRYYPHVHNMDGFYVAKIVKVRNGERMAGAWEADVDEEEQQQFEHEEAEHQEEEQSSQQQQEEQQLGKRRQRPIQEESVAVEAVADEEEERPKKKSKKDKKTDKSKKDKKTDKSKKGKKSKKSK